VLAAAGVAECRLLVVADLTLTEKIQVCGLARRMNPRVLIAAGANSDADKAWLQEFGVHYVSDAREEQAEQMARAIRNIV
jgi:monovalent cation:H+ antiporter-2, CPA2 family